jgi:hypothetical protein
MKPMPFITKSLLLPVSILGMAGCTGVQDPTVTAGLGSALSGIGGYVGGDEGRIISAAGMVIVFQASMAQKEQAQKRAEVALQKPEVKRTVETKKARYVAVPVKPAPDQKTKSKNLVMLYDTKTGSAKATAYEPKKASYAQNEEATFGGHKAVVAQSFAGI